MISYNEQIYSEYAYTIIIVPKIWNTTLGQ